MQLKYKSKIKINKNHNKKSQITVFVIIGIVIVVLVVGLFIFKDKIFHREVPASLAPVYNYYTSCIEGIARDGARIVGSQAGYIENPDFSPGSEYAPFSSQLGFLGIGVPYWYYISSNGLQKEQVPTINQIEAQFEKYMREETAKKCGFSDFENQGFEVDFGEVTGSRVSIKADEIIISLAQSLTIKKGEESFEIKNHKIELDSSLGKLYDIAKKIYDLEKKSAFLENYSTDVLYTYAPVAGAEISCSPVIWNPYDVIGEIKKALEANIQTIRLKGDYYSLKGNNRDYFVVDSRIDLKEEQISFLYSKDWPSRFEVWPTKGGLMKPEMVGNQRGLSMMGFCYSPYKFVYDMYFPVLIQIYNSENAEELFQFPFAVVISKNNPREAVSGEFVEDRENICDNANTEIEVNTYNVNLDAIEAGIEFKCLEDSCYLGKTKIDNTTGLASLRAKVPQCLNGIIIANSEGYSEKKYIFSSNEERTADVVLERNYKLDIEIYVDGSLINDFAIITVSKNLENSSDYLNSVAYPNMKTLDIAPGDYSFDVKVYRGGSINVPGTTSRQCVNVPKSGILGMFGMEEEKCTTVNVPSQTISNLIYAGGKANYYAVEGELENAKTLKVYAESVKFPSTIEELQDVYDRVEVESINIELI